MATMAAKPTRHLNDAGDQVYPCRCGETHEGDYALYEYAHHNCFHRSPLLPFGREVGLSDLICPECGEVFHVADDGIAV